MWRNESIYCGLVSTNRELESRLNEIWKCSQARIESNDEFSIGESNFRRALSTLGLVKSCRSGCSDVHKRTYMHVYIYRDGPEADLYRIYKDSIEVTIALTVVFWGTITFNREIIRIEKLLPTAGVFTSRYNYVNRDATSIWLIGSSRKDR